MAEASSSGEDDESSESNDRGFEETDDEEKRHFLDVCWSFVEYRRDVTHDVVSMRKCFDVLSSEDYALWMPSSEQREAKQAAEWFAELNACIDVNAAFLRQFPSPMVSGADLGPYGEQVVFQVPPGHRVQSRNSSKVRSTLRQFVRDWAKEGEAERATNYGPLIRALLQYVPPVNVAGQTRKKVLCPGCGLGRLPYDLARLGYAAQGNEFSYHMLLGSHLILNRCASAECHTIFPFALSTTNRRGRRDHLRPVKIPDLNPRQALPPTAQLSMAAGEFVEVYKDHVGEWDALATCFFLDTAKNVMLYIRTFAEIIKTGGYWINIGPLLYHYADVTNEISIELSWEEVRRFICNYFDFVDERQQDARYTTNSSSLMNTKYRCMFFVVRRNSEPVRGLSNPVF